MPQAILLDPWTLALKPGASADEYVSRLIAIEEGVRSQILNIEISAHASELLESEGLFPLSCQMPPGFWASRSDIYRIVGGLISRLPKVEDRGIEYLLIETCTIEPAISEIATEKQQSHLAQTFGQCAVHHEYTGGHDKFYIVSESTMEGKNLFKSDIQDIDHRLAQPPRLGNYEQSVQCSQNLINFFAALDSTDLAAQQGVETAIMVAVWQALGGSSWPIKVENWSFGRDFDASIKQCNIENNPARMRALIRTCVGIITSMDLRATHWLRIGHGATSPQKTRSFDKSCAWRIDIDDELHLHYWATPSGSEFANVVTHNNFHITE